MLTLGTKIRKLRELRNLKQEHMAEVLGISQSTYSKIEKDETEISEERLEQISKALSLTPQDILGFDERIFFSVTNRDYSSGGYIVHHNNTSLPDTERKLYEDKIKLLEDMVAYLKKEIERFKS